MLRTGGVLLALAFYIYTIIDVARTPKSSIRTLPKYVWMIIAVVLPILGGVFWLFLGRVWPQSGYRSRRRTPRAPTTTLNSFAPWKSGRGRTKCESAANKILDSHLSLTCTWNYTPA